MRSLRPSNTQSCSGDEARKETTVADVTTTSDGVRITRKPHDVATVIDARIGSLTFRVKIREGSADTSIDDGVSGFVDVGSWRVPACGVNINLIAGDETLFTCKIV